MSGVSGGEKKKEKFERQNAELQQRVCDQEEELSQLRQLREELVDSDKIKALEEDMNDLVGKNLRLEESNEELEGKLRQKEEELAKAVNEKLAVAKECS